MGVDGVMLCVCLFEVGYFMCVVGENLVGGFEMLDEVLVYWLVSFEYCENLMEVEF